MSHHQSKPKEVKAATYESAFSPITNTSFSSDFGTGTSSVDTGSGTQKTTSTLSAPLQGIAGQATSGLGQNLHFLQQDPSQQFGEIASGNNPLYNTMAEQNKRLTDQTLGRAELDAQGTGNTNSTTLGSELGRIHNDDLFRQNANMANAWTLGNQNSQANAGINQGVLTALANLSYPLGAAANTNLQTAMAAKDQAGQFNATQQQAAAVQNLQTQLLRQQQQAAQQGALFNTLGTLGGAIIGGPLGGATGGVITNVFGGGGAAAPQSSAGFGRQQTFGTGLGAAGSSSGFNANPLLGDFPSMAEMAVA
jgi:hypothetical protein